MMKHNRLLISFVICSIIVAGFMGLGSEDMPKAHAEQTAVADYYVSPMGSDDNSGTLEAPLKTIQKARDTVRERIAGGMTKDITVMLRGGNYALDQTLTFNEGDSGKDGFKVVYKNYPGEEPVLNGGKRITNWEPYQGNIYKAKVGDGKVDVPEQLGDELLINSGFENGLSPWVFEKSGTDSGDTAEINTSEANSGSQSLHIHEQNTNGNTAMDVYQWINVDNTKTYRFTFWAKYVSGDAGFRIMQADGTGKQFAFNGLQLDKTASGWKRYTGTIGPSGSGADMVWNTNTVKVRYELRNYPSDSNYRTVVGEAYYDDASFKQIVVKGGQVYNGLDFNSLFENGERSEQARYPNIGVDGKDSYNNTLNNVSRTQFSFAQGDIPVVADPGQLQVYLGMSWIAGMYNLKSIDYPKGIATLEVPSRYNIASARYYVQGAMEFLDQPGEFYLDKTTGTLYYWPRKAPIEQQTIDVPQLKTILEVKGSTVINPVHDLVFDGLVIRNTDLTDNYYFDWNQQQSTQNKASAVWIENARNITVVHSQIYNAGMNGLRLKGLAQYIGVEGNLIYDVGGTGICLEGPNSYSFTMNALTATSMNDHNNISNNNIFHTGFFNVYDGYGIDILASGENTISHNQIHDTTRGAIQVRNYWPDLLNKVAGDGVTITMDNVKTYAHARNNVIEYNDVFNAITEAGDAGIIYAYQTGSGNVIDHNWVHDTNGNEIYGITDVHGIYLDNFADDFTVTNNIISHLNEANRNISVSGIFDNISQGGHMPMGKNVIKNNFIVDNNGLERGFYLWGDGAPDDIVDNIVTGAKYIYSLNLGLPKDIIEKTDQNLFYDQNGEYRVAGAPNVATLDDWKQADGGSYDQHSIIADPGFINRAASDYRLGYDSPAVALGIKDIDLKDIGLTSDYPFSVSNDPINKLFVYTDQSGDKSWTSIPLGSQEQLHLLARTLNGYVANLSDADVSYSSDNEGVASVNGQGVVTAINRGVARITITVNKAGATKTTVLDILSSLDYASTTQLVEHNQLDVKPMIAKGMDGLYDPESSLVSFTSDNEQVAAVDDQGIVTGNVPGTANIVASVTHEGVTKYARVQIQVIKNTLDKVIITSDQKLMFGTTGLLLVSGIMLDGKPADLKSATITFSSNAPETVTVDSKGMATVKKHGQAILSADVTLDGVTKTGTIAVMNRSAFETIQAESFDKLGYPVSPRPDYIWNTNAGGWAQYKDVDFAYGASEFKINVAVDKNWAGGRVEVRLDAPDGTLAGTLTAQSTGSFTTYQTQSAPIQSVTGTHDLFLVFPDKAGGTTGNVDWFSFTPVPDETPPVTTLATNVTANVYGWYNTPVTVNLVTFDNLSGVAQTVYSLDQDRTWQSYTGPFTLDTDGHHELSYRSTDRAGNEETVQTQSFNMDTTMPTITVSGLVSGSSYDDSGDLTPLVAVIDGGSGVDNSQTVVTLDGAPLPQGTIIPLYTLPLGSHTLQVVAADLAGNRQTANVSFTTGASIESLKALVTRFAEMGWIDNEGIANSLQTKLANGNVQSLINEVQAQSGKHITTEAAGYLLRDANQLK